MASLIKIIAKIQNKAYIFGLVKAGILLNKRLAIKNQ